jgi:hypothetical protein
MLATALNDLAGRDGEVDRMLQKLLAAATRGNSAVT